VFARDLLYLLQQQQGGLPPRDLPHMVKMRIECIEFLAGPLSLNRAQVASRVIAASQPLLPGTSGVCDSQKVPFFKTDNTAVS
jgi:hypothetical protein